MIELNDILRLVNNALSGHYFKDITFYKEAKLKSQNSEDQIKRPYVYEGDGNYKFIQEDTKGLIVYHRNLEFTSEDDENEGYGRNPLTTETYSNRVVFYGSQSAIDKDCEDINMLLAKEFKSLLPRKLTLIDRNILKPGQVYTNMDELSEEEGITPAPDSVFFAIDYTLTVYTTKNCVDLSCDSEVIAPCKPVVIYDSNGNVLATVASGEDYTVEACPPVPTPSGIAYQRPFYSGANQSYRDGDEYWNTINNPYPAPPSYPAVIQSIDETGAAGGWNTLKYNNQFGNKTRYTDSLGGTPNGAVEGTFLDNLTGLEIVYASFYGNWNDAIDHFHNLVLNGNSDYRLMSYEEMRSMWYASGRFRALVYTSEGSNTKNIASSSTRYDLTTYTFSGPYTTGGSNVIKTTNYTYIGCRTFA